jgi:hypothetical protein
VDWKTLISELTSCGYTQPAIAAACRCGQATISDLAKGTTKDPRHSLGEALRRLHAQAISTGDVASADAQAALPFSDLPLNVQRHAIEGGVRHE